MSMSLGLGLGLSVRRGSMGGGGAPSPVTGFASSPTLRGDFLQGQVIYSDYAVSDPLVVAVQDEWLYNGVMIFGELNHTFIVGSTPTVGDTIQHRARTKNGAGWSAWVTSGIKTYATPVYMTTRYFGADTFANAGGFPAPAGATSITNAGGTNLILSSGSVVPATDGVASGTITFNTGVSVTIIAVPNARSVASHTGLRTAMQATGLVRGTHKILMRGGVLYNPTRERLDTVLGVAGIGGTVDVGYVDVIAHANEPAPIICHIDFNGTSATGAKSEFAFRFYRVIFGGPGLTDSDISDPLVSSVMVTMRGGNTSDEYSRGVRFEECYFGNHSTDLQADRKRRMSAIEGNKPWWYCDVVNCVFDRVTFAGRYPEHSLISGNLVSRFTKDAFISNMSGCVYQWNIIERSQPVSEEFTNPTVISNIANAFTIDVGPNEFMKVSTATAREDGGFTLVSGDGDLAPFIGQKANIVTNSTTQNGTEVTLEFDFTGVNFATVTSWSVLNQSYHVDMLQSTRRDGITYARSPINRYSQLAGYDAAFVGNSLGGGDWPYFGGLQGVFSENQNGLDAARTLFCGNQLTSVFAYGGHFPDQGSLVALFNTVAGAKYPNSSAYIGITNADGLTGAKNPEDMLIWGNIAHKFSVEGAVKGVSIIDQVTTGNNLIISSDGSNATSLFEDPIDVSTVDYYDPIPVDPFQNYRTLASVAASKIGGAGNPNVSYTNQTLTLPPIAYGGRVATTGVVGTLQVSGRNLAASDDVYWLLSNLSGATYTAAQIKAAGNGGALPANAVGAGKKAAQSPAARWTDTVAALPDGSYKLHSTADRGGTLADAVVTSSPLLIVSNAAYPTVVLVDYKRGSASATGVTIPSIGVSTASTDIYALEYHRGYGVTNSLTIGGVEGSTVAADITPVTSNRYCMRRVPNPGTISSADVTITGAAFSSTGNAAVALVSASAANTFIMNGVAASPTTGATSVSTTADVKVGDVIFAMLTTTNGDFGAITWTGIDQLFGSGQCGTATSYTALASKTIAADNAAYALGASFPNARNNVGLAYYILRKV